MNKFDYLLFDLDGTLTDSSEGIVNSYLSALREMNLESSSTEKIKSYIGPSIHKFFEVEHNLSGEKLGKAVTYYREYYILKGIYENKLYNGIFELLNLLTDNHKKIYLVTGKPTIYAKQILQYLRIDKYFINVFGSELGISNQSKEELIKNFLDTEKADPGNCIMIGDRMHDIKGARYHNIKSAGVTYGFGGIDELKACNPDYLFNSVSELAKHLL